MEHLDRGLSYVHIDLNAAKIFIFADGLFANNKNLSSQLGFLMILAYENHLESFFALIGNIMHWSSTKCVAAVAQQCIEEGVNLKVWVETRVYFKILS
jgi:hypothetical protein